jgi:hypothetical protein
MSGKPRMGKVKLAGTVRVRVYPLLADAMEGYCRYRLNRYYKHRDLPKGLTYEALDEIADEMADGLMSDLCEFFDFSGDDED